MNCSFNTEREKKTCPFSVAVSGTYFHFNLQFVFNFVLNKANYLIIEVHINGI